MKILKFSAIWCAPCKTLKSQLEKYSGYEIVNKDFDRDTDDFVKYNVKTVPTMIAIDDDGTILGKKTGSCTLNEFEDWLKIVEDGKLEV